VKNFQIAALVVVALVCSGASWAGPEARAALLQGYKAARAAGAAEIQGPIFLRSSEGGDALEGDAYAVIEHPFAQVESVLKDTRNWCDVLVLHLNVKHCRAADAQLILYLGQKVPQSLEESYRVAFTFRANALAPDYMGVQLTAAQGPVGTRDYRMVFEAAPLEDRKTLVHLTYAYGYGLAGRLAMSSYLATAGSGKIGFTVVGQSNGRPVYVKGVRGVVERNTMRYFLAVETWLDALDAPPDTRLEKRLDDWFEATERFAPQLHELARNDYLDMKRGEYARQRSSSQ